MALQILCLETYWSEDASDRRSVKGMFELIKDNSDYATFDHRHFSDRVTLSDHLNDYWRKGAYDVLYIAAHGGPGTIQTEYHEDVTLLELAKNLEGACAGRVIYFGTCSTLNVSSAKTANFLRKTRAAAVVGYRKRIDWLDSAIMDLHALAALAADPPGSLGTWPVHPAETLRRAETKNEALAKGLRWTVLAGRSKLPEKRKSQLDGIDIAIDHLLAIAEDRTLDNADRTRAIRSIGALKPGYQRDLGKLVRKSDQPMPVRKAALTAIGGSPGSAVDAALIRLRDSLSSAKDDDGATALLEATEKIVVRR